MQNFRELSVWEKSHTLTLGIYKTTSSYPKEELYGLTSQMRRSASSIPSNIAEGCGRNSQRQLAHFLNIAFGSASELEYQIILSKDLGYISNETYNDFTDKVIEIKKMLSALNQKVKN